MDQVMRHKLVRHINYFCGACEGGAPQNSLPSIASFLLVGEHQH
jgi:hypothetical protein